MSVEEWWKVVSSEEKKIKPVKVDIGRERSKPMNKKRGTIT